MDWNTIIQLLISGGIVGTIVEVGAGIRYRKSNKTIKESEATVSDVNAQKEQMNLAQDYMEKVKELSELTYQATLQNGKDNTDIITEVREVKKQVGEVAEEQRNIVRYLNGNYQAWLENQQRLQKMPGAEGIAEYKSNNKEI